MQNVPTVVARSLLMISVASSRSMNMKYCPNATDALCAYYATVVHMHGVPLSAIGLPGLANIDATEWGDFIISDDVGGNTSDNLIAICTYLEDDKLWAVQLRTGKALGVSDTGCGFVVVEE